MTANPYYHEHAGDIALIDNVAFDSDVRGILEALFAPHGSAALEAILHIDKINTTHNSAAYTHALAHRVGAILAAYLLEEATRETMPHILANYGAFASHFQTITKQHQETRKEKP